MTVTSVLPEDAADKTYTWSSANEEIATVDENGKVTAVAAGTVKITTTAKDGSGVKAECDVTVKTAAPDGYVDLGVVGANGKLVFFQNDGNYVTSAWDAIEDKENTLPSKLEFVRLVSSCYWQWVDDGTKKGYYVFKAKATADKGKKSYDDPTLVGSYDPNSDVCIFLPATPSTTYWMNTLLDNNRPFYLSISSNYVDTECYSGSKSNTRYVLKIQRSE